MKFNPCAIRPLRIAAVVVATLGVTGWAARVIEGPAWDAIRANQPAMKLGSVQGALGQGVTVGLLGGFRAIVADLFWIRMTFAWDDYDLPATQTYIRLVTTIDPRPRYFWLNGARIIAHDQANWRLRDMGGFDKVPKAEQDRIDREQADVALALLNEALAHHPEDPRILTDMAIIELNRGRNMAAAAELYRRASLQPRAPYFAGRLYAELLRRMGRNAEAYAWLKNLYPTLPQEADASRVDPATGRPRYTPAQIDDASADVVLARIRELEETLSVPPAARFTP